MILKLISIITSQKNKKDLIIKKEGPGFPRSFLVLILSLLNVVFYNKRLVKSDSAFKPDAPLRKCAGAAVVIAAVVIAAVVVAWATWGAACIA